MTRHVPRSSCSVRGVAVCLAVPLAQCLPTLASADPVPVLDVTLPGETRETSLRATTLDLLGTDALSGPALARLLDARLGRPVPADDPLAPLRQEVVAAVEAYFGRGGVRECRRRLDAVIASLDRDPVALEARADNLAALLRALTMRARIALESHENAVAEGLFARIVRIDTSFAPDAREFPPSVVQAHRAALAGVAAHAVRGEVVVRVPEAACTASIDGAAPHDGPRVILSAEEGAHRVVVRCGTRVSRAHPVAVTAAGRVELVVDPRADLAVIPDDPPRLAYRTEDEARTRAPLDAATLGQSLGARRVVLLDAAGVRVVDVADARVLATLPAARVSELRALATGVMDVTAPSAPPVVGPSVASTVPAPASAAPVAHNVAAPSLGPWITVGAGALVAGLGGVFFALRESQLSQARSLCPTAPDGSLACAPTAITEASGHQSAAQTDTALAITGFALGGAAIVSGVIWYVASRPSVPPPPVRAWVAPSAVAVGLSTTF